MAGPIHIVLTFDDNFWAPAVVAIRSTCLATTRRTDLVFHLVHQGLSSAHKADLEGAAAPYGATLRHYPLENRDFLTPHLAQLPKSPTPRWTTIAYARLFLHDVLPHEVRRFVYMDADVYVRRPIEELYGEDLGEHVFAAAEAAYHVEAQVDRQNRDKLGLFHPALPYFNSGVLVIDLERWAGVDILAEFRALLGSRADDPATVNGLMLDQDVLNLVFRGRWKKLDPRWNFQDPLPPHEQLFPFIVHYCGVPKPWFLFSKLAFARRYRHCMTDELFYRYARFRWSKQLRQRFAPARARP